jgi:hypothetical protein
VGSSCAEGGRSGVILKYNLRHKGGSSVRLISIRVVIAVQFIIGVSGAVCQVNKDHAEEKSHLRMETPYGRAVFLEAHTLDRRQWRLDEGGIVRGGFTIHLSGNVVTKTDCSLPLQGASPVCLVLRADEAEYHEDTGQIEATGTMYVRFEPNSK